jgi:hypothetical protein
VRRVAHARVFERAICDIGKSSTAVKKLGPRRSGLSKYGSTHKQTQKQTLTGWLFPWGKSEKTNPVPHLPVILDMYMPAITYRNIDQHWCRSVARNIAFRAWPAREIPLQLPTRTVNTNHTRNGLDNGYACIVQHGDVCVLQKGEQSAVVDAFFGCQNMHLTYGGYWEDTAQIHTYSAHVYCTELNFPVETTRKPCSQTQNIVVNTSLTWGMYRTSCPLESSRSLFVMSTAVAFARTRYCRKTLSDPLPGILGTGVTGAVPFLTINGLPGRWSADWPALWKFSSI